MKSIGYADIFKVFTREIETFGVNPFVLTIDSKDAIDDYMFSFDDDQAIQMAKIINEHIDKG